MIPSLIPPFSLVLFFAVPHDDIHPNSALCVLSLFISATIDMRTYVVHVDTSNFVSRKQVVICGHL